MNEKIINKTERFSNTIEHMDTDMDAKYTAFLNEYGVVPTKDEPEKITLKRKCYELYANLASENNPQRRSAILLEVLDIQDKLDEIEKAETIKQYGSEEAYYEHMDRLDKLASHNIKHIIK